jgi:protocatechuate 3,4-dioxygenase, beta subunit
MKSIIAVVCALSAPGLGAAQGVHLAPTSAPARVSLTAASERGAPLSVSGRVVSSDGRPVPNASIYVYQTDANGEYVPGVSGGSDRPRLFGLLRSDGEGRYRFTTIRPGSYPNSRNPAHIHFEVSAAGQDDRIYEIVFEGDPFISERFRQQASETYGGVVIVALRPTSGDGFEVSHDVRLKARSQ